MLTAYIRASQFDASSVDDIWQETMLIAWRRIDDFDTSRPFGPWLRGIAQKIILSKYSKLNEKQIVLDAQSLEYLSLRFESVQSLNGDTLDDKLDALRDCISLLPEHEQACIHLRFRENLMPAEMSQRLNLALEAVKKRLVRAKQHLIDCMDRKLASTTSLEALG